MIKILWSEKKNRQNIIKHKVDFSEAQTIFDDPLQISKDDLTILLPSGDLLPSAGLNKIDY